MNTSHDGSLTTCKVAPSSSQWLLLETFLKFSPAWFTPILPQCSPEQPLPFSLEHFQCQQTRPTKAAVTSTLSATHMPPPQGYRPQRPLLSFPSSGPGPLLQLPVLRGPPRSLFHKSSSGLLFKDQKCLFQLVQIVKESSKGTSPREICAGRGSWCDMGDSAWLGSGGAPPSPSPVSR